MRKNLSEKKRKGRGLMSDPFREYIEAEVDEIMSSMDERCRQDPELCSKNAIEWIEKNAEFFRKQWNERKKITKCFKLKSQIENIV